MHYIHIMYIINSSGLFTIHMQYFPLWNSHCEFLLLPVLWYIISAKFHNNNGKVSLVWVIACSIVHGLFCDLKRCYKCAHVLAYSNLSTDEFHSGDCLFPLLGDKGMLSKIATPSSQAMLFVERNNLFRISGYLPPPPKKTKKLK